MKKVFFALVLVAAMAISCSVEDQFVNRYLASDTNEVNLYSIDKKDVVRVVRTVVRGGEVEANLAKVVEINGEKYYPVEEIAEDIFIYAKEQSLVETWEDVVQEKTLWARTPASIIDDIETSHVAGLADKGEELTVTGFASIANDGSVNRYKVSDGSAEGYVYAKYLVRSKEEADKRYKAEMYDKVHSAVRNSFGGGAAIGCDFYPVERVQFGENKMPEACYSLYLNNNSSVLGNIEKYIELAKQSEINTFVIDIKDNERPDYKADAMKLYSPINYRYAESKGEKLFKNAVKRLHEEGFYVVGRITCFKDTHLVKDNPKVAITEKATNKPFYHNKAYWPSPYDRAVWQFNIELAKESVRKFGFDEINLDYVRFPDRMTSVEKLIDYHNRYDESKVQAIQRFVQYACDEIHAVGA